MRPCQVCGELSNNLCSGCERVGYCCNEHQLEHWSSHKSKCSIGSPIPSTVSYDSMKGLLKYYKFKIYKKVEKPEKTKTVLFNVLRTADRVCRNQIKKTFISEIQNKVDVVMVFSHERPSKTRTGSVTIYDSYVLIEYNPKGEADAAYIHLVCNQDTVIGGRRIKLQLGAILHGIALHFLVEHGYEKAYLEAASSDLIPYYAVFSYVPTDLSCDAGSWTNTVKQYLFGPSPQKPAEHGGWRMRLCNIQESMLYTDNQKFIDLAVSELKKLESTEDFRQLYGRDSSPVRK